MAPFYGWDSTASRIEPLRGGSLQDINILKGVTLLLLLYNCFVLLFSSALLSNWLTVIYNSCQKIVEFVNFPENEQHQIRL